MHASTKCGWVLVLVAAHPASAATCTWTGADALSGNWSAAANWSNCAGAAPTAGDSLVFPDSATRYVNSNDLAAGLSLQQLQFDGRSYDIGGNALTLTGDLLSNVPGDPAPVFFPAITLDGGAHTFNANGTRGVSLRGTLSLGGSPLSVDGVGPTLIEGNLVGAGGLVKNGVGTLFLSGSANTYSGATTIGNGVVRARSNSALGATGVGNGTTVTAGATLTIGLGHDVGEALTLSGNGYANQGVVANEGGDNTASGPITLAGNITVGNLYSGTTLTLSGVIDDGVFNHSLTKIGVASVRLTNTNTFAAAIVNAGTLQVDGAVGAATINSGGVLAGSGVCSGQVNLLGGGEISPGERGGQDVATFDLGNLAWASGGVLRLHLGPPTYSDRLAVAGAFSKAAAPGSVWMFDIRDGATAPMVGVAYTLVSFGLNTTFTVGDFGVSYSGTGAGANMTGTFALGANALTFTPTAVVSDLIFRHAFD